MKNHLKTQLKNGLKFFNIMLLLVDNELPVLAQLQFIGLVDH